MPKNTMLITNSPVIWKTTAPCLFYRYNRSRQCFYSVNDIVVLSRIHRYYTWNCTPARPKYFLFLLPSDPFCCFPILLCQLVHIDICTYANGIEIKDENQLYVFLCVLKHPRNYTNIILSLASPTYYLTF